MLSIRYAAAGICASAMFVSATFADEHAHHHHVPQSLSSPSSTVIANSIIATPGITVGTVTPWPMGIGGLIDPYRTGYLPYGVYAGPYFGGAYALPPLVVPASLLYGPGQVQG